MAVCSRYFIELQTGATDAPRRERDRMRHRQAGEFMRIIQEWLREHRKEKEVTHLSVTALGQVMIVCPRAIMDFIREQDVCAVAHIRSSDQIDETRLIRSARERAC